MKDYKNDHAQVVNHNEMHNCNVFNGDIYGGNFPLPGGQVIINQILDPKQMKKQMQEQAQNTRESAENRDEKRKKVMEDIIRRFDFSPEQLTDDRKGKPITNERLGIAFAQVFGLRAAHTPLEKIELVDQLWSLLTESRKQCFKEKNEDFFRQTVLNILGSFKDARVISGLPHSLAQSVFPGISPDLARNISRGTTSTVFPKGTDEHVRFYVEKLLNGDI